MPAGVAESQQPINSVCTCKTSASGPLVVAHLWATGEHVSVEGAGTGRSACGGHTQA